MIKIIFCIFTIIIASQVLAEGSYTNGNMTTSDIVRSAHTGGISTAQTEAQYMSVATSIYQRSGLAKEKVSWEAFDLAYREYLLLKAKGKVYQPFIIFVNFSLPSSKKRMIIAKVDMASPGIIGKTEVAHGRNSGTFRTAKNFSDAHKSYKSSLGAYEFQNGYGSKKFKNAVRIEGVTSGFNLNAKDRAVVFHSGWYVNTFIAKLWGRVGKSLGCFTVSKKKGKSIAKNFSNNKSMIYAYHDDWVGRSGVCKGGKCLPRRSLNPKTVQSATASSSSNIPLITDENIMTPENSPYFANSGMTNATRNGLPKKKEGFLSMGKLLGITLVGAALLPKLMKKNPKKEPASFKQDFPKVNHKGNAEYSGSTDVEVCQQLANKDWKEVVIRTQNGEDPHRFFKASWKDLSMAVQSPLAIDDYQVPVVSKNHLNKVRECAALATIYDKRNFDSSDPNRKRVMRSRDGKMTCQYQGAESLDFHDCTALIRKHEEFIAKEKKLFANQSDQVQEDGKNLNEQVAASNNIQSSAHVAQESMRQNVMGLTKERSAFQEARLQGLAKSLNALPNHRSVMRKCQSRYAPHNKGGIADYMAFNAMMADTFPYSLGASDLNDPCAGAVNKLKISYVQNHHVRAQTEKVLEEIGVKKSRLAKALRILDGQNGVDFNGVAKNYKDRVTNVSTGDVNVFGFGGSDKVGSSDNKYYQAQKDESLPSYQDGANDALSAKSGGLNGNSGGGSNGVSGVDSKLSSLSLKEKKKRSQINGETSDFDSALSELNRGNSAMMAGLIKSGSVPWRDILYLHQNGKITKTQISHLSSLTGNKVVRLATVNSKDSVNSDYEIHKDKNRSIFSIISRRYATKNLGVQESAATSK